MTEQDIRSLEAEMDVNKLKQERTVSKGAFTRLANGLKKAMNTEASALRISARFQKLSESWDNAQEKHINYVNNLADETIATKEEAWIADLQDKFENLELDVDNYIATETRKEKVLLDEANESRRRQDEELSKQSAEKELVEKRERFLIKKFQESEKFDALQETLQSLLVQLEEESKNKMNTSVSAEDSLQQLEVCFKACEEINYQLILISDTSLHDSENSWFTEKLKSYSSLRSKCKAVITRRDIPTERVQSQLNLRMDKMKFERFDGSFRKYRKFKEEFQRHIKTRYQDNEEAFVLQNFLEPAIKEEVDHLGEDAVEIWKRLDSKYGDDCKLVDVIMGDVKRLKKTAEKPSEILLFINTIERAHRDLQYIGKEYEINNSTIIASIEEKLPASIEIEWLQRIAGKDKERIRKDKFSALLELLLEFKERIEYQQSNLRATTSNSSRGSNFHINDTTNIEKYPKRDYSHPLCWLHPNQSDHPIWRCNAFQKRTPEERNQLTKEHNACFMCLQEGHHAKDCDKNFKCNDNSCKLRHHWLLHNVRTEGTSYHHGTDSENHTLLLIQKARASNSSWRMSDINILWDSGSTLSFITFKKAEQLKLQGIPTKLHIYKVGGELEELDSKKYTITLQDLKGVMIEVKVMGIRKISNDISRAAFPFKHKPLNSVDPNNIDRPKEGEVECLIGFDYASLHPVQTLANGNLCLFENRFGKVVGGSHPELRYQKRTEAEVHFISATPNNFFEMEQLGVACNPRCGSCRCGKCHPGGKNMSIKEEKELKLISDQLTYDAERLKWEAAYPWIKDPCQLPNNRSYILNGFRGMEKRLLKDKSLATEYQQQIEDMLKRNVCRKLIKEELNAYKGPVYYIAHHGVIKEDSQSTPLRIVFNSSANYRGHVLNDYYAKGLDMLNGMLGILLRFREGLFGFVGDIKKMYHSISIPIIDQMTHRFLWRDLNKNKAPEDYAMTAVNFGDKPSGAMAIVALQKTAELGRDISSQACETIKHNSYMDDILDSCDTQKEAVVLMKDIDKILALGGFTTKGWSFTNKTGHQDEIGVVGAKPLEKVLGMRWDPDRDAFKFKIMLSLVDRNKEAINQHLSNEMKLVIPTKLTKRWVLAQLNRIYDPLGLIAPLTVKAKILMRKLWTQKEKLDWDDMMPDSLREEWISWFEDLSGLDEVSFRRCIKPPNAKSPPSLVIYSDGSKEAYGAVAYCHWEINNGYYSQLIASKNRVAPIKIVDIVKLELCGALLGARLRTFLEKEMRLNISRVLHIVDSEIVKAMVNKDSYGFNTFAANRIGEIQQLTDRSEWYWIPGKLNVADLITHGGKAKDVSKSSDWHEGPMFMKQSIHTWPIRQDTDMNILERVKLNFGIQTTVLHTENHVPEPETLAERIDITRFGTLEKLLNTTARILHLYKRFKFGSKIPNGITSIDVADAEILWIKDAQKTLRKEIGKKKHRRLFPRLENDVVVVGGRAERWMQQTWNRQTFILLPNDHPFSQLLATSIHKEIGHLGNEATVASIRRKYWIIRIHGVVKKIRSQCVPCKKKFKLLTGQIMADLPVERLKPSPPFHTTGLDYFGPFVIKGEVQKRVRGKCFGVIFTCFVSRIVYVDLCQDYSTDAFLMALRRFATIHGWPQRIHSVQGSQLVSASNELRGIVENFNYDELADIGVKKGFEWSFSAPDAPWMNGVTEALVKTVKSALKMAVGDELMTFPELQTVMFECSCLVNQRPIGKHPVKPEDGSYLCPNDLRLGRASPRIPQGPFQERTGMKHRFDFLQGIVEGFWKRWTCQVFPTLVIRSKWHVSRRNVEVGDIVLVKDNNAIRGEWRLAKVTKTKVDTDWKVRRVHIMYNNAKDMTGQITTTEVERAIHNLVVLVPNDQHNNDKTDD